MRKLIKTITNLLLSSTFLLSATTGITTTALATKERSAENSSSPDYEEVELQGENLELLLPSSYEQYLALDGITDIAVKADHFAVANGKDIFLYNGSEYTVYTNSSSIMQLSFNDDLVLYFLDETGNLFTMDCNAEYLRAENNNVICSAFTLSDNTYYYALSVTGLTRIWDKRTPTMSIATLNSISTTVPVMYYAENKLYYTDGTNLISYNENGTEIFQLSANIFDAVVKDHILYYTDKTSLYSYDLATHTPLTAYSTDGANYTSLSLDGDTIYVTATQQGTVKICTFDTDKGKFTNREIGSASTAPNRLHNAVTAKVFGNRLLTIDGKRLSIYDRTTQEFSILPLDFEPTMLAANENSVLLADNSFVMAFDYSGKQLMSQHWSSPYGTITGVTYAGGHYYISTASNIFVKFSAQTLAPISHTTKTMAFTTSDLTADIYGDLYVLDNAGNVYRYTESELMSNQVNLALYTFPSSLSHLSVDIDRNLYASDANSVYCSNGKRYTPDPSNVLFRADRPLSSFTFGYEDNTVYFLYKDFILGSSLLDIPSLAQMECADSYERIFLHSTEGVVPMAEIAADSVLLYFDMGGLVEDIQYFPSCSYSRTSAPMRATVLTKVTVRNTEYYIVSFSTDGKNYRSALVLSSCCKLLPQEEYLSLSTSPITGYTSTDVSLYKFPCLFSSLTVNRLPKNSAIAVLGTLTLYEKYYYVSVETETGKVFGYLPYRFIHLTDLNALSPTHIRFTRMTCLQPIIAYSQSGISFTLHPDVYYNLTLYDVLNDEGELVEDQVTFALSAAGETFYATVQTNELEEERNYLFRNFVIIMIALLVCGMIANFIYYRKS